MSEGIRKPWLRDYLVAYAEKHGGERNASERKKGKVQIIKFITHPTTDEQWVWAEVSDKTHFVVVRFTIAAVKAFNSSKQNVGRGLISRRWAMAQIQCVKPFRGSPPLEGGGGQGNMILALEVDHVEIVGSEGEAMFGQPKDIWNDESLRRWIEAQRNGNGGDILKLEKVQRDKEANDSKSLAEHNGLNSLRQSSLKTTNIGHHKTPCTGESQRSKWEKHVISLGLVSTFQHFEIPEDQLEQLQRINVFGLNRPIIQEIQENQTEGSDEQRKTESVLPNTPSHWSVSQRSNLTQGSESDNASNPDVIGSSDKEIVDDRPSQHDLAEEQTDGKAHNVAIEQSNQNGLEEFQGTTGEEMAFSKPPQDPSMSPSTPRMELQSQLPRKPVILVPDSDLSGSQSQSLTQPSVTQLSVFLQHVSATSSQGLQLGVSDVPVNSTSGMSVDVIQQPQGTEQNPEGEYANQEESELDTNNEAAEQILTSPSRQDRLIGDLSAKQQNQQHPKQSNKRQETQAVSQNARLLKTKRMLKEVSNLGGGDDSLPPAPKRVKRVAQGDDIQIVRHDAAAWKEPSFLQSKARNIQSTKMECSQDHSGSDNILAYRQELAGKTCRQSDPYQSQNMFDNDGEAEPPGEVGERMALNASKLGDWRPHKHIQKNLTNMTWRKYRDILLGVGQARRNSLGHMEGAVTLVYDPTLAPQAAETSSSFAKTRVDQDGRYEKEGKRWVRRRENSHFVGNRHIVKPSTKDFELPHSHPRTTFPKPLPSFLARHASIPPVSIPVRDPLSANAGRYSLSLKGVRRELRKGGPGAEHIVLDIEREVVEWLTAGGVVLHPDTQHEVSPSKTLGNPLGTSQYIREIHRSPMELVWRVDDDFPRFLLHCVARYHNVVSYSKTSSGGERLTHLLRPNVTRPDFLASKSLDTPPTSDMDAISNTVDTDESDIDVGVELAVLSEEGEFQNQQQFDLQSVPEEHDFVDTSVGQSYQYDQEHQLYSQDKDYEASIDGTDDDEALSISVESVALAPTSKDWERTPMTSVSEAVSSSSGSPSRPAHRTPRRTTNPSHPLAFWHYVYG